MQSDMLAKCIAISRSHFLNVPYKDLTIDQIYGVDDIGNKASRICHYCSVDVLKNILENESLRFSDVRFLNDSTEFIEIIPLVKYVAQHEEYASEFIDMILNESLIKELESYRQPYIGKEKIRKIMRKKSIEHIRVLFQRTKIHLLCGIIMQHLEVVLILFLILHGICLRAAISRK